MKLSELWFDGLQELRDGKEEVPVFKNNLRRKITLWVERENLTDFVFPYKFFSFRVPKSRVKSLGNSKIRLTRKAFNDAIAEHYFRVKVETGFRPFQLTEVLAYR